MHVFAKDLLQFDSIFVSLFLEYIRSSVFFSDWTLFNTTHGTVRIYYGWDIETKSESESPGLEEMQMKFWEAIAFAKPDNNSQPSCRQVEAKSAHTHTYHRL